jgi:hypothetical protein
VLSYKLFIAVVKAKNSTKQEIFVIFYGMKSLKMNHNIKSIRTFIGAKNYNLSRQFYLDFGFEEIKIPYKMSYFKCGEFGFYLQDAYVKRWVDNSMIFLEVQNVEQHLDDIKKLNLITKYKKVKISEIQYNDWGNEYFIHDPSGVLWHIGEFKN